MKARVLFPLVVAAALGLGLSAQARSYVTHAAQIDVADNALVAMTGTVEAKENNTIIVNMSAGDVRVHIPNTVQWLESYKKRPIDGLEIGDSVTVYGKIETDRRMPKIEAHAVYLPEYDRLFFADAQKALMLGEHVRDRLAEQYMSID